MNYARQMVNYKPAKRGLGNSPFILDTKRNFLTHEWGQACIIVKDKDLTP